MIDLRFDPDFLPCEEDLRFQKELDSWQGTAYRLFSQAKGVGTDCIRFVCAMGDFAWKDGSKTKVPRIMADTSMHQPEMARKVMRFLMEQYDYRAVPASEMHLLRPKDVVITAHPGAGPGHAIIAGTSALYHTSENSGFSKVGFDLAGMNHVATLRRKDQID